MNLGQFGVWTFALELQPATRAQEIAHEIEKLGYGTIWFPEVMNREAMANAMLLLSATSHVKVATGVANIYARDRQISLGASSSLTAYPRPLAD